MSGMAIERLISNDDISSEGASNSSALPTEAQFSQGRPTYTEAASALTLSIGIIHVCLQYLVIQQLKISSSSFSSASVRLK